MTDYADLKAKAEAATRGPWFVHPTMEMDDDGCMSKPTNLGWVSTDPKEGYLTVVSSAWDGDAMYIAAASPDVVLALLEENGRLREDAGVRERLKTLCDQISKAKVLPNEKRDKALGPEFAAAMDFGMKTLVGMIQFDVLLLPGKTLEEIDALQEGRPA